MKLNQTIIRSIVALMLVIATMFSMSSCIFLDYGFYEEVFGESDKSEDDDGSKLPQIPKPNQNQNENQTQTGNDGEAPEFLPENGSGEVDKIPALQQTLLSTVLIISEFNLGAGAGAGVIYQIDKEKGDAYIITNQHVVYDENGICKSIKIYLYGMVLETYAINARYIGGSTAYDIAVLKIEGSEILKNSYAKAAELGKSSEVRVFDTVYAVGNPEAYGFSVTQGIVSVRTENLDLEGADGSIISLRVMRIDAAVNHGNSGGGLYDDDGRLIGIVSAKTQGDDVDNMGYAIPIDLVKNLANNILYYCDGSNMTKLNRALLGITISSKVIGAVIDENGNLTEQAKVEVMEVSTSSLAFGKVQVGDVVNSISVDGVKVEATEVHLIPEHMLNARVGSTIVMNVTRGNQNMDITFTITKDAITIEK